MKQAFLQFLFDKIRQIEVEINEFMSNFSILESKLIYDDKAVVLSNPFRYHNISVDDKMNGVFITADAVGTTEKNRLTNCSQERIHDSVALCQNFIGSCNRKDF